MDSAIVWLFQVTSLALQGQELYIGTAWGCLVVVEASSLRPITVFRPYEDEVSRVPSFRRGFTVRGIPLPKTPGHVIESERKVSLPSN